VWHLLFVIMVRCNIYVPLSLPSCPFQRLGSASMPGLEKFSFCWKQLWVAKDNSVTACCSKGVLLLGSSGLLPLVCTRGETWILRGGAPGSSPTGSAANCAWSGALVPFLKGCLCHLAPRTSFLQFYCIFSWCRV